MSTDIVHGGRRGESRETLGLVIPCFNEAGRLDTTQILCALSDMPWLHLVFVNDGSVDATQALLLEINANAQGQSTVIDLPNNVGKAEAVRRGLQYASEHHPHCGFWDADLSAPLSEVEKLRYLLIRNPSIEWVNGIRLRSLGRRVLRKASRHYLGRVFVTIASVLLEISAYDTQCGAKVFRSTALLEAVIKFPFHSRWIFDIEMLVRLRALAELRQESLESLVLEYPLAVWEHREGSKVRAVDFLRAFSELMRVWSAYRDR